MAMLHLKIVYMENKELTTTDSLKLINEMIGKAKNSYHDSGISPMLWGSIIILCSLVNYYTTTNKINLPFDIWLLTIVAIVPQVIISMREKKVRKFVNYNDEVLGYIWMTFGISMALINITNNAVFAALKPSAIAYKQLAGTAMEFRFSNFILTYLLILYSIPTLVTGLISKYKPMIVGGIIFWCCTAISIKTNFETDLLLTAIGAFFGWLLPGILLFKRYRKAAHV
jgi:hypothetical protein